MSLDHDLSAKERDELRSLSRSLSARAEEAERERDSLKAQLEQTRRDAKAARKRLDIVSKSSRDFTRSARSILSEQHRLEGELRTSLGRAREARNDARESHQRLEELVDDLGVIVWEAEASEESGIERFTLVGKRCEDILGYPRSRWLRSAGFWMEAVHPEDRENVRGAYRAALREGSENLVEFRVFASDGGMLWLQDFVRPAETGGEGDESDGSRLRGLMVEITERKRAEEKLRKSEERFRLLFEQATEAVFVHDLEGGIIQVNEQACLSLGYSREKLLGMTIADVETRFVPGGFDEIWRKASKTGETVLVEGLHRREDGSTFPVEVGVGRFEGDGSSSMLALARDITDRKRAEEQREAAFARERRAKEQLSFLAGASRELASSLDPDEMLSTVSRLAARVADWCAVDLLEEDQSHRLAISFRKEDGEMEVIRERTPDEEVPEPVRKVASSGESYLIEEVTDSHLEEVVMSDEHLATLRMFGLFSYAVVPLRARGRTFGTISFVRKNQERGYGPEDLELFENFASRAALALDNSRLHERQRHTAQVLQRSLLPPELPEISGVEVAARFQPLGEGVEVGGDFYDLFQAPDGEWAAVMGDVCGKGPEAAAVTALARYTLRSETRHEQDPSQILRSLNAAMLIQNPNDRFCTVLYARMKRDSNGEDFTLRFASGGHPLPMILRGESGSVEEVGEHGTLLGVFDETQTTTSTVSLSPGDVAVFYTDGVTEARKEGELFGEERLRGEISDCAGLTAGGIADALESRIHEFSGGTLSDDAAILVIRANVK